MKEQSTLPQRYLAHRDPQPGQSGKGGSRGEESLIQIPKAFPRGCHAQENGTSLCLIALEGKDLTHLCIPCAEHTFIELRCVLGRGGRGLGIRLDSSRAGRYCKPK